VLFIDDEPLVLRSLDRSLRTRKVPWDTRFVDSSQGALRLLASEPFDVVIADLRIPDMDGVELLGHIQRQYPHIARLVLSGQVGTDDCLRAMRVAHQCMAKPCNLDTLRHVVNRLSWSRSLIADSEIATVANQMSCLPSPPRIHFAVCEAIGRNAGLAEIAGIIDGDLALTSKLMQVVSSAFFAQGSHITTVQRALAVLGTDVVRGLLLGIEVFRAFEGDAIGLAQLEALRTHSKRVAHIACAIAPSAIASDAFAAGMLHDVGELVLAQLGRAGSAVSRTDHARAGGFLLGLWGISDRIAEAIAYHHEPGAIPDEGARLVDIVHVAEIIAGELDAANEQRSDAEVISADWLARHDPRELDRMRAIAREHWIAAT
jgi:HD-like signal output (HDOD) protein